MTIDNHRLGYSRLRISNDLDSLSASNCFFLKLEVNQRLQRWSNDKQNLKIESKFTIWVGEIVSKQTSAVIWSEIFLLIDLLSSENKLGHATN